ncbi:hypothetical protein PYCC9005_005754 [Savitreella phatthalungensis]
MSRQPSNRPGDNRRQSTHAALSTDYPASQTYPTTTYGLGTTNKSEFATSHVAPVTSYVAPQPSYVGRAFEGQGHSQHNYGSGSHHQQHQPNFELKMPGTMPPEQSQHHSNSGGGGGGGGNGGGSNNHVTHAPTHTVINPSPTTSPQIYAAQIVPFIYCSSLAASVRFYERLGLRVVPTCSAETGELNVRDDERIMAPEDAPPGRRPKICLRQMPAKAVRPSPVVVHGDDGFEVPPLRLDFITPKVSELARHFHDDLIKEVRSRPRQYHEFQCRDPDGTLVTVWCNKSHMDKAHASANANTNPGS